MVMGERVSAAPVEQQPPGVTGVVAEHVMVAVVVVVSGGAVRHSVKALGLSTSCSVLPPSLMSSGASVRLSTTLMGRPTREMGSLCTVPVPQIGHVHPFSHGHTDSDADMDADDLLLLLLPPGGQAEPEKDRVVEVETEDDDDDDEEERGGGIHTPLSVLLLLRSLHVDLDLRLLPPLPLLWLLVWLVL